MIKKYKIGKLTILKKNGSFVFVTKKKSYILQFTTKEPWWLPKCDNNYAGFCKLWGWLFVYFGWYHDEFTIKA